ncbi:ABC transporter substrate-binding protein [Brachybacterium halotolerans subsp. kimchii]|uniref:ABC transporter substrate-binding protein n=1 Tax=Brachybacterium halotolerans TaxID=2795215 RepID=A0ABS1B5U9_9MICO|nr:ABC transporter substrate-binding protein [Brachybacterium halotolerans]MBK0329999.1 ABC transporter substrate-binding protein [Brachybacterium halotolerans]UEJ83223.1 ABC transporter substrate-binding protein [Brachybacterium halotolerans subsp. kimchii]
MSHLDSSQRTLSGSTRRGFLAASGAAGGVLALAACGGKSGGGSGGSDELVGVGNNGMAGKGRSGDAADQLFIAGFQWSPPTNFNTFAGAPAWPASGNVAQYVYETLLRYDIVSGDLKPGLAAKYEVDGTSSITLTLQDGITWHDGTEFTTDDVLYTFELGKIDESLGVASFWVEVDEMTADGSTISIAVNKDRKNVGMVLATLAQQFIVPKAVFEKAAKETGNKLASWETKECMGTGPYTLEKADQTQIILARNEKYWGKDFYGGLPAPTKVIHPIFKSNEDGNLKFQNGELDVMQQFIPQISKMWDSGKPVGTYLQEEPYFVAGSMPMFLINTTKDGLKDPEVRRAMAYAVDYASIAETAMSGYSPDVVASLILPEGAESEWIDKDKAKADGWSYDPKKAEQILTDAGYAKGSDGIYAKDGVKLGPWKLITPQGWTDWNAALEIVAKSFTAVGISAATNFPQQAQVTTSIQNGDFDLACWYVAGANPATPWQRFSDVMSNVELADLGKTAYRNYGRWENDEVNDLLEAAAAAADDDTKKKALTALDDLFRKEVPAFPLMYRPDEFFEFNASNWSNWPTEKNDYAPPMFRGAGNEWIFKIQKIGG